MVEESCDLPESVESDNYSTTIQLDHTYMTTSSRKWHCGCLRDKCECCENYLQELSVVRLVQKNKIKLLEVTIKTQRTERASLKCKPFIMETLLTSDAKATVLSRINQY